MTDTLQKLLERIKFLERGCSCGYDYRCSNCQTILDIKELAEKVETEI